VIADQRTLRATATEVSQTLAQGNVPAGVVGGIATDAKGAELLRGEWGGRLDKTLLIRTARETAQQLVASLPSPRDDDGSQAAPHQPSPQPPAPQPPAPPQYPAAPQYPPAQQQQLQGGQQHQPGAQQRGAAGRHSAAAQPTGANHEAGEGRWTTA
jgi:hypothetical protein